MMTSKKKEKKKTRKLPNEVYNVIMQGEEIIFAFKKKLYFEAKPPWVFITNKRIFVLDLGIGGYSFIDYPYEEITHLRLSHGLFFGSFEIESEKGDKTIINWIENPEPFFKIKNYCTEKIREVSTENPTIKESSFFPWKTFEIKRSPESSSRVKMQIIKDTTEGETTSYAMAGKEQIEPMKMPQLSTEQAWSIIKQETKRPSEMLEIARKMLSNGDISEETYKEIISKIIGQSEKPEEKSENK